MKIKIYDRIHGHLRTLEQIIAAAYKSTNTRGEKYPAKITIINPGRPMNCGLVITKI